MSPLRDCLLVFLGGGLGALARFGVGLALPKPAAAAFPVAILLVNVTGCLALGALIGWASRASPPPAPLLTFAGIGLLGGYTTFSTFGIDALELLREGRTAMAASYVVASVVLGIGAAAVGMSTVR